MSTLEEFLTRTYRNPDQPGSFFGAVKLRNVAQKAGYNAPLSYIKSWLQDQNSYNIHKQTRKPQRYLQVRVTGPGILAHTDLMDVGNLAEYNSNIKFLLVLIDSFSKRLDLIPLKSKNAKEVKEALEKLLTKRPFQRIVSDSGGEYVNAQVAAMLRRLNIRHTIARNTSKAFYAERVIRTMRMRMSKYFEEYNTQKYEDKLQSLVDSYNNTPHTTLLGETPARMTKARSKQLWWSIYRPPIKRTKRKVKPYTFSIGDTVRVSRLKSTFEKESQNNWTEEIFKIKLRFRKQYINLYTIKDYLDEDILGLWYEAELSKVKVDPDTMWRIESVLKRRTYKGVRQLLIKWQGFPKRVSSFSI